MKIFINGEPQETHYQCLADILKEFGFQDEWVATAVNGEIVPAVDRAHFMIKPDDKIEILSPMQGG